MKVVNKLSLTLPHNGINSFIAQGGLPAGSAHTLTNLIVRSSYTINNEPKIYVECRLPWQGAPLPAKKMAVPGGVEYLADWTEIQRRGDGTHHPRFVYSPPRPLYNEIVTERLKALPLHPIWFYDQAADVDLEQHIWIDCLLQEIDLVSLEKDNVLKFNIYRAHSWGKAWRGRPQGKAILQVIRKNLGDGKTYSSFRAKRAAILTAMNQNSIYFNRRFFTTLNNLEILQFSRANIRVGYPSGQGRRGDPFDGKKINWLVEGKTRAPSDVEFSKIINFTTYWDQFLIIYGNDSKFFFLTDPKVQSWEFKSYDLRKFTLTNENLNIVTMFTYVIPKSREEHVEGLYIITKGGLLIGITYEETSTYNIWTWKRYHMAQLPSPLKSRRSWMRTADDDILLILENGIHSLNQILQGGKSKLRQFQDQKLLTLCDDARLIYSPQHELYFLELFFILGDKDHLIVKSYIYMADSTLMAWSQHTLGAPSQEGHEDPSAALKKFTHVTKNKIDPILNYPMFITKTLPLKFANNHKTDLIGMRYNQLIFYTDNFFDQIHRDIFLSWDISGEAPIPVIEPQPIGINMSLATLFNKKKGTLKFHSYEFQYSVCNAIITYETSHSPSPYPSRSSVPKYLKEIYSGGQRQTHGDVLNYNNEFILFQHVKLEQDEDMIYVTINGDVDSRFKCYGASALLESEEEKGR